LVSNRISSIVFCHDNYIKVKDAKNTKYHLLKKYLQKYLNAHKLTCIWYSI